MAESGVYTVLVVDDNEAGRYATSRILRHAGFTIREAATAADALRLAREHPHLILLDVNLPDGTGYDVVSTLKADPATAGIPVVHLSATHVKPEDRAHGLEAGADAYLTQPVDARELVAVVTAVLRVYDADRGLRSSPELVDAVVNMSPDPIFVKDLNGRYLFLNPAAEALIGKQAREAVGRDDTELFGGAGSPGPLATSAASAGNRGTTAFEGTVRQHGQKRSFVTVEGPLCDDHGRPYAVFGISRETTDRDRAEAEVRRLNADLEAQVLRRTAELERANSELEAFAYSVSHDLRAPLRAIDGFSYALLEDYAAQLDATATDYLARVRAAANRMGVLIDDLLRLSRITQSSLDLREVDITDLAREIGASLCSADPARDITFVVADGLRATADAALVSVLLENLLSNAVKFTSKHEHATIEVGSAGTDDGTAFYVKDDGAGFDMTHVDKMFTPFHRLHDGDDFPGTGIGLTTARRIVHRHRGRMWAEGAPEEGATLWFTLPGEDR